MGNCVHRCFGIIDRRKRYLRSKYNTEENFSIEFENLMEELVAKHVGKDVEISKTVSEIDTADQKEPQGEMSRLLTDREQQLLKTSQFDTLAREQRKFDSEIDEKLKQHEEELEREEEAFYEAKREAARIARMNKAKEQAAKKNLANGGSAWPKNDEEWEIAGGEDDFEMFLANVKARSLATRSQVKNGSGDGHSSSSSNAQTKASSLDMEWEHEAGMSPNKRPQPVSVSEDNWSKTSTASPLHSSDLEWDADFVSADDNERLQLINSVNASKLPGNSSNSLR